MTSPDPLASSMLSPRSASDLDMAFPSHVMGTFLPKPEWIGERSSWLNSSWGHLADALFAGKPPDLSCSMEHDDQLVSRHVHVCLGSYEPSHQDKIAGVAFLLAVWMDVEWPAEEQARAAELQKDARQRAALLTWDAIES